MNEFPRKSTPMPELKPVPGLKPKRNTKLYIGITAGAILALAAGIGFAMLRNRPTTDVANVLPSATPLPTPTPTPAQIPSLLNGVLVPTELANRHPLSIMIENHPDARPQSGLSDAAIVYEAIAEGGITRFMALYDAKLPPKAGPVRSARIVFVNFAQEYTPVSTYYAHAGGAANALDLLRSAGLYDLDGLTIGSPVFQRIAKSGIASEHTLYTYPDKLLDLVKTRNYKTDNTFQPWKFKDDADVTTRPDTQTITIPFSSASYTVKYTYDKTTNTYKRSLAGSAHVDANNSQQLSPKNVVVEFATYNPIISGHKEVQEVGTVGTGAGKLFEDGKVTDIKWSKPSASARTIYTDAASGQEIQFNRGQIWVEVPKVGTAITVQ